MVAWLSLGLGVHVLGVWIWAFLRGWRARQQPRQSWQPAPGGLVSIVIPAWNERASLDRCLRSLEHSTTTNWECVIVAGGPDQTLRYARRRVAGDPRFQVVEQPPQGKNAALNTGLRLSRGEIVILLDADCVVAPDWLGLLIAPLRAGYAAALSNYQPSQQTTVSRQFVLNKLLAYGVQGSTVLHGGAIALQRRWLDRLGGSLPETVKVGTDWDLDQRLTWADAPKAFVAQADHTTPLPSSWPEFMRNEIRWRRGHLQAVLRAWRHAPHGMIMGLAPYGAGLLLLGGPCWIIAGPAALRPISLQLWLLWIAWTAARQSATVGAVAAYTHEWRWLSDLWLPVATWLVTLICCVLALCTLGRISPHFQGARPLPEQHHG